MKKDMSTPIATEIQATARQVGAMEADGELARLEEAARDAGRRVSGIRAEITARRAKLSDLDQREGEARTTLSQYNAWEADRAEIAARAMIEGSGPDLIGDDAAEAATWERRRAEAVRTVGAAEAGRGILAGEIEALESRLTDAVEEHVEAVRHAAQRRVNVAAQVYALLVDLLSRPLADALGAEDANRHLRRQAGFTDERLDAWGSVLLRSLTDGGPEVLEGRSLRRPTWLSRHGSQLPGRDERAAAIMADLSGVRHG